MSLTPSKWFALADPSELRVLASISLYLLPTYTEHTTRPGRCPNTLHVANLAIMRVCTFTG